MWNKTEVTEETSHVDEETPTFTHPKTFGLTVYLKIQQHEIFISELCLQRNVRH